MRASVSYWYAHHLNRGDQAFRKDKDGTFSGNPSLSLTVSRYMKSLRRKKTRAGVVSTSVRAISEAQIKLLYDKNEEIRREDRLK
jgi:hypothetical protein